MWTGSPTTTWRRTNDAPPASSSSLLSSLNPDLGHGLALIGLGGRVVVVELGVGQVLRDALGDDPVDPGPGQVTRRRPIRFLG